MITFKKVFLLFGFTVVVASSLSAQTELITNGNFSGGSTNWNLGQYGGSSGGSVTSGEYRILVTTAGSEYWHVQFTQSALSLVQGKTYLFSFDACKGTQNSGAQSMQVNIGQSYSPYASYFGSQDMTVPLTTTKTHYTYMITMTGAGDQNARVEFNCGKSTGGFHIDNVSLVEQAASVALLSAAPLAIDYGSVITGSSKSTNVALQNAGGAATTINAVQSSSGSFSTSLSVPATVPAAGSIIMPITFTPSSSGNFTGAVTIYSDASDNPTITLNLSGTSSLAGIGISPNSLDFSTAPGEAASQAITLSNSGSATISWSMTSNSSWATVSPASGSVAAGSNITCNVTAAHSTAGTYTGTLSLTHSASNQPSPVTIDLSLMVTNGYQPTSPYIQNPERAIDFIRDIATFRMKARDNTNGGFYTNINRQGFSTSANEKSLCGQSRIAYAFTRAFMVTGDELYLEQAHHALKFLYDHGWNNGWYFVTDSAGNHISHWGHDNWWGFQQHYALVGIAAMVEATGGTMDWNDGSGNDHTWLMRGVNSNYTKLWDANEATKGYYNYSNTAWTSKWDKGFAPTVDGATTHALLMALMYDSTNHKQRLIDLADNITDYMVGNMSVAAVGFPEIFNEDWSIDYGTTNMDIGHGYKTAWVLQRAYLCNPGHSEYRSGAQALMQDLWDNGCYDEVNGGPYSYVNWQTGAITGHNKDFWMTEQGLTSGLISYYTATTQAQRDMYIRVADGSLNFFMDHLMDPVYGEAYAVVSKDGSTVVDGSKGGLFTAGYHSTELGYYTYLYSSLYYHKTPADLYYYYPEASSGRTFKLTPIAIEDNVLKITAVTHDGAAYTDFDPDARTIHLPAGTGGKFKITYGFAAMPTHTITATAGAGGSIAPSGAISVNEGSTQSFTITPASGYHISDIIVDGQSKGATDIYNFPTVTAGHTISAVFSRIPAHTITATATSGGTIAPPGAVSVDEGSSVTFTCTPSTGYVLSSLTVDGTVNATGNSYTFTNVSGNHTISAAFSALPTTVFQINCGGSASTPYTTDGYFNGGTSYTVTSVIATTDVTNPAPQAVYQSERYGTIAYTLPGLVAGSQYLVRLHFAELYWTASGKRTFNVVINGTTVLSNFDIYAATGARYKAVVKEFAATANGSGQIVINFNTVTDNATIEGIEIIPTTPNDPPTIITAAAASPNPVAASTTSLSVLGDDDNGEADLTYTWTTTGTPLAPVAFSANGTNAAKTTTATFTKAGLYAFRATVTDKGNRTATSPVTVTVNQTSTAIAVSPATASVQTSVTQQFTATANDQFGNALTTQPAFTWSVSGGGVIDGNGLFTAGTTTGGPFAVTARSGSISSTASITVFATPTTVYRINCGGNASSPFTSDKYYSGGTARSVTNTIDMSGVTNPAPQAVYQSERYGTVTYTLPDLTPQTQYTVRLHFAETYWTASGKRKFNVLINGSAVLSNYDIYAATGARYKAVVKEFSATANSSGQIIINFNTVTDNATIEGIEIIR